MKRALLPALCSVLFTGTAFAGDLDQINALAQAEFKNLSKDLTAALSYKPLQPAEAMGITGFDIGIGLGVTEMKHSAVWDKASSGGDFGWMPVPKLHVSKGLPFNINIGGFYTQVPTTNIKLWGAEVSYAILPGTTLVPALAVRGAYTKLSGVNQLDFDTKSIDVSVSKGLAMFTPYVGVGYVWADSTPNVGGLVSESIKESKIFAGLNFNILTGNLAFEADKTGDSMTYSAKVGIRF
ncbi:MAG: hypothetical protein B7Y41_00965 [Hydrogenophilales bacterium 28-61-23]|nr:MAG: hypothetical protein B7Y41_00965 [Hydrogenophilales bacterium 28-61-23]